MVLENDTRPPLQAAYTASPEEPTRAASDAMFTMRPFLRAAIAGSTAWCMCSVPTRLIAMSRSHCAGSVLVNGAKTSQPALFTSTSIRPSACPVAVTAASTLARSMMSHPKACAWPPSARMALVTRSAASRFRSNTATFAPSAPKRRQVAPPMPPPVTTTAWFSKRCIMVLSMGGHQAGATCQNAD